MIIQAKKFFQNRIYLVPENKNSKVLFSHIVHDDRLLDTPDNRDYLVQLAAIHGTSTVFKELL